MPTRFDLPTADVDTQPFWDAAREQRFLIKRCAAVVDLEEGPRAMTNVVECDFDDLAIGMPLEVVFRPISDDVTIPLFRPARAGAS
jgi:uncharacterized OB-fold protein